MASYWGERLKFALLYTHSAKIKIFTISFYETKTAFHIYPDEEEMNLDFLII